MLERRKGPAGLALSRQNLPVFERGDGDADGDTFASARNTAKGAYVLAEAPGGTPDVIFIATGSEVQIAVDARERLEGRGRECARRFRSLPRMVRGAGCRPIASRCCRAAVKARVSIEAGIALGWRGYVGDAGRSVSIEHFGASADYKTLYAKFHMTTEARRLRGARVTRCSAGLAAPRLTLRQKKEERQNDRHHHTHRRTVRSSASASGSTTCRGSESSPEACSEAHRRPQRRRGHHQPHDLRCRARQGRGLRRPGRGARQGRHERHRCRVRDHDQRCRGRVRHLRSRLRGSRAARTAGCRSRSSPGLAHDAEGTIGGGQAPLGQGRPPERA